MCFRVFCALLPSHLFKLHFSVTSLPETEQRWGTNGNKQLTDSLMDPHPVGLLVLCITEEKTRKDYSLTST